jgi:DnaJ-class molecular chaperone
MNTGGRSYYNVLNVPTDAKDDDIKKAYRKLAMKVVVDIPTVDHEYVSRHMSHFTCGGW